MKTGTAILQVLFSILAFPLLSIAQVTWVDSKTNPLIDFAGLVGEPSVVYDSAANRVTRIYFTDLNGIFQGDALSDTTFALYSLPAISVGSPGQFDSYSIWSADVVRFRSRYYMYYTAASSPGNLCIGLALSDDGVHWQKHESNPVLGPGPGGSWDSHGVAYPHVEVEGDTLYMWYSMVNDKPSTNTGLATSTDGVVWIKSIANPVILNGYYAYGDIYALTLSAAGVAKVGQTYYMTFITEAFPGGRQFGLATSQDRIHWWKFSGNPVLTRHTWDAADIGVGTLLFFNDKFHFWYTGLPEYGPPWRWNIGFAAAGLVQLAEREPGENLPQKSSLSQNYPNPFNPLTKIQFTIANRQLTIVKVFDLLGTEVTTLVNEVKPPGTYVVEFDGSSLSSGVYFYRLQAGDFVATRRLLLLK